MFTDFDPPNMCYRFFSGDDAEQQDIQWIANGNGRIGDTADLLPSISPTYQDNRVQKKRKNPLQNPLPNPLRNPYEIYREKTQRYAVTAASRESQKRKQSAMQRDTKRKTKRETVPMVISTKNPTQTTFPTPMKRNKLCRHRLRNCAYCHTEDSRQSYKKVVPQNVRIQKQVKNPKPSMVYNVPMSFMYVRK